MSIEEYVDYSKCKEATFISKKFKDWISFDSKTNEKVIDLVGYLAWETVGLLTQTALIVKRDMELKTNDLHFTMIGIATGVMNDSLREMLSFVHDRTEPDLQTIQSKKPLNSVNIP